MILYKFPHFASCAPSAAIVAHIDEETDVDHELTTVLAMVM